MQDIKQTVGRVASALSNGSPSQTGSTETVHQGASEEQVAMVWQRLTSIYGHKWASQYGATVEPLWGRAMQSLPVERLKIALSRCAKRDDAWPPSLPEFMALARIRPNEIGAPDEGRAFSEAVHKSYPYAAWSPWSHKCVYWAAIWTGQSDLCERGQMVRKQFDHEYQVALDQHADLSDPPRGAIEAKTYQQSEEERIAAAEAGFAKIKAILNGGEA